MGTSHQFSPLKMAKADHPHAYGDKIFCVKGFRVKVGSSPRVWGQADKNEALTMQNGIIPTRMGTRVIIMLLILISRDHPHAYGDKNTTNYDNIVADGSSPRVWGQALSQCSKRAGLRIIPTRMGTRSQIPQQVEHV